MFFLSGTDDEEEAKMNVEAIRAEIARIEAEIPTIKSYDYRQQRKATLERLYALAAGVLPC